jgi:zinc protease
MRNAVMVALASLAIGCATTPEAGPGPSVSPSPGETARPAASSQKGDDPEPWRARMPSPAAPPELVVPEFQKATLSNGLTVLVSERHDLPLVSMAVAFAAGSAQDPKGKAGLADLTHKVLLEGAGKRDAIALDQAFADLGGAPFVLTRADGALVGTRVLKRNAASALALLADVVIRPALRAADFERRKQEHLRTLSQQLGSPGFLAQWAFASALYGPDHPYGKLTSGTPETVGGLTAAEARAFWETSSGPKAAALVVTGDTTLAEAKAWAEQYLGKWSGKATRPPVPPEVKPDGKRQLILVPKPGLVQTIIAMGRPAIESGHPDEAALELASTVFGGFFGSRLNMNLREAKGYSYGAGAFVDPRRGDGPLMASSSVRADVTGPAVQEFLKELAGLKSRPITAGELEAAREGLIRSLPGTFQTVEDLSRAAAGLFWEEKQLDHYRKLAEQLERATPQQVQAAAEKYFEPSSLDVVLVGDPDQVSKQVRSLGIGELVVRDPPSSLPARSGTAARKSTGAAPQ